MHLTCSRYTAQYLQGKENNSAPRRCRYCARNHVPALANPNGQQLSRKTNHACYILVVVWLVQRIDAYLQPTIQCRKRHRRVKLCLYFEVYDYPTDAEGS